MAELVLNSFESSVTLGVDPSLDAETLSVPSSDAILTVPILTSDLRNLFTYASDSFEGTNFSLHSTNYNDLANTDLRFFVNLDTLPVNFSINPANAEVTQSAMIPSYSNTTDLKNMQTLKFDMLRYLAREIFTSARAVDLFNNENLMSSNLEALSFATWINNLNNLRDYSTLASTGTRLNQSDTNGKYYSMSSDTANANVAYQLFKQLLSLQSTRFQDISQYHLQDGTDGHYSEYKFPFMDDDIINFKLTINPSSNAHTVTGAAVNPRSYLIKLKAVSQGTLDSTTLTTQGRNWVYKYPYVKMTADDNEIYSLEHSIVGCESATANAMKASCQGPFAPNNIPSTVSYMDGWYYQNTNHGAATTTDVNNSKITWYIYTNGYASYNGFTLGDLRVLAMNLNIVSKDSLPFFSVYTEHDSNFGNNWSIDGNGVESNINDNAASWYRSRVNYMIQNSGQIVVNSSYDRKSNQGSYMIRTHDSNGSDMTLAMSPDYNEAKFNFNGNVQFERAPKSDVETRGPCNATEVVKYIVISTDSSAATDAVKFLLQGAVYGVRNSSNSNSREGEIFDFTRYASVNIGDNNQQGFTAQ